MATAATAATALTLVGSAGAVGAVEQDRTAAEHCVAQATDTAPGQGVLDEDLVCYPTLAEALAAAGGPADDGGGAAREGAAARAATVLSSVAVATHFDGTNRTGASLTVSAAGCDAFLNLSSGWINRISSTQNYCATVRFFEGYDKAGSNEVTGISTVNLGALNNGADSIYYGT